MPPPAHAASMPWRPFGLLLSACTKLSIRRAPVGAERVADASEPPLGFSAPDLFFASQSWPNLSLPSLKDGEDGRRERLVQLDLVEVRRLMPARLSAAGRRARGHAHVRGVVALEAPALDLGEDLEAQLLGFLCGGHDDGGRRRRSGRRS